jgi:hypothetical protein
MSVWMKAIGLAAVPMALAGCGMMKDKMPGGSTGSTGSSSGGMTSGTGMPGGCTDDRGVEQLGKDMDAKTFDAVIASQTSLAHIYDAAGKKPDADKARATVKKWQDNKDKAPTGGERIKVVSAANDSIQKEADALAAANKTDEATKTALKSARMELRKALVYVAWGSKIGTEAGPKAKEAIEANKACATKTKGAVDAAAGLSTLVGNMKKTYGSVDAAAKKAGNGEMTDAEKKESESGAPSGLGV